MQIINDCSLQKSEKKNLKNDYSMFSIQIL